MNRNELIAQLAAEMSTTRAAVERMAGTVFSAIGDGARRAHGHRGVRDVRRPQPRRAPSPQSPNRRARRHRRLPGAVVQGREGPSRPGQRLAWRRRRTATGHVPRRLLQGGAVDISALRHAREHLRGHAWRLNPLACAFPIRPDANCQRRHCCARLRTPNTGGATDPLSPTARRDSEPGFRTSSTKIPVRCTR